MVNAIPEGNLPLSFVNFAYPFSETVNCMTGLPMQMENKLGVGLTWTLYSCSAKLINQIDSN